MNSIVTQHFAKAYTELKAIGRVKSVRQFAISLDHSPQSMDLILKAKRDVTVELMRKVVSRYQVNANYLCLGEGQMFATAVEDADEAEVETGNILYVPATAKAGYGDQFHDSSYLAEMPRFSLPDPRFKHGQFRCFAVEGDSMEPSLHASDQVVCSPVEQQYWASSLRDHMVYVVVVNGDILVKRVVNRIAESRTLELLSDNDFYQPRIVDVSEVREIWRVEVKINAFKQTPRRKEQILMQEIEEIKAKLEHLCNDYENRVSTMGHLANSSPAAVA